jgi:hypothetical protein
MAEAIKRQQQQEEKDKSKWDLWADMLNSITGCG